MLVPESSFTPATRNLVTMHMDIYFAGYARLPFHFVIKSALAKSPKKGSIVSSKISTLTAENLTKSFPSAQPS